MTVYRLAFLPGALHDSQTLLRYPLAGRPGYPTRERAEQVLASMPDPSLMCIVEED